MTKPDFIYAKWEKNPEEPINPNDEIMAKDTGYLTDEKKMRKEIIQTLSTILGTDIKIRAMAFGVLNFDTLKINIRTLSHS